MTRWIRSTRVAVLAIVGMAACTTIRTPRLSRPDVVPLHERRSSPLKVHLHSGNLVVLESWVESGSTLDGNGGLYGQDRQLVRTGTFRIPHDSIALLETKTHSVSGASAGIGVMAVWTALWGALTVTCVVDPKACFGSCPTFYADVGGREMLLAEGFSASIARVLEARDVDALHGATLDGRRFTVRMTNEALETHAVRAVRLHVVRRSPGQRVFRDLDGRYYQASRLAAPQQCTAGEGDCLGAVQAFDSLEQSSPADSMDLATREVIELEFPSSDGSLGLVLAARQSLVSTFLFYQTIAYLGSRAGDWLAALERSGPEEAQRAMGMARVLGGIEVLVQHGAGDWRLAGTYDEAGPIATDLAVIPLGTVPASPVRVRLRMAKGAWRVNQVALADLGNTVDPVVLEPVLVERSGQVDSTALRLLRDSHRHLVTYPGDEYRISFALPDDARDAEVFLESQGYYYEWMRAEWLAEENAAMAALALLQPAEALRRLAPEFKRREPHMERLFLGSRYGR